MRSRSLVFSCLAAGLNKKRQSGIDGCNVISIAGSCMSTHHMKHTTLELLLEGNTCLEQRCSIATTVDKGLSQVMHPP